MGIQYALVKSCTETRKLTLSDTKSCIQNGEPVTHFSTYLWRNTVYFYYRVILCNLCCYFIDECSIIFHLCIIRYLSMIIGWISRHPVIERCPSDVPTMFNRNYSYDHRLNVVSLHIQASVIHIFNRASGEYRTHCKFSLHSSYEQHRIYVSFFL